MAPSGISGLVVAINTILLGLATVLMGFAVWYVKRISERVERMATKIAQIGTSLYGAEGQGGLIKRVERLEDPRISRVRAL